MTTREQEPQCRVRLIHKDKSEASCVLPASHQDSDSDHQDEHGCTAHVLVTQATIEEVRRWQDIPFPWERDQ